MYTRLVVVVGATVEMNCNRFARCSFVWSVDTGGGYADYIDWHGQFSWPRLRMQPATEHSHTLVILDAQRNDSGFYNCYDGKGERKIGYHVTVIGTPFVANFALKT